MIDYSGVDTEFLAGRENIMTCLKLAVVNLLLFLFWVVGCFYRTGITKRDGPEFYIPYLSHYI